MPPINPAAFIPVITKAAAGGLSGAETLRILRSVGYAQRTQAFYAIYRQARAAALAVPEIQLLSKNAYVPANLMQEGGELQRYPYQYYIRYDTIHGETGEVRSAYYTLGSRTPLTKGQALDQAADIARKALDTTNVILSDVQLERAYVRANL